MGVITVEGSFEQAYYCEQDCITQAAMLIAPCDLDGPGYDIGRALAKGAAKVAVVLYRSSISEAAKTPSSSDGSTGPSIQALNPVKGVDPIEVSSNLSP